VTLSGKVQINVCLPGQDRLFVTLEVVWTHVRMQVAPVVINNGRVVVVMMTEGADVGRNGRSLDTRETGHTTELLSRGLFGSLELPVDVIRGRGG